MEAEKIGNALRRLAVKADKADDNGCQGAITAWGDLEKKLRKLADLCAKNHDDAIDAADMDDW